MLERKHLIQILLFIHHNGSSYKSELVPITKGRHYVMNLRLKVLLKLELVQISPSNKKLVEETDRGKWVAYHLDEIVRCFGTNMKDDGQS